jgi:hypothetical protein
MTTNIIFPAFPGGQPSSAFDKEAVAAKEVGFGISLVSDENEPGPIRVSNQKADSYIYHGWLVKPAYYKELHQLVPNLLVSYDHYMWSYDFPRWYSIMADDTPKSVVFPAEAIQREGLEAVANDMAECFPGKSFIIKDYFRSCKHEWFDACFIKDVSDTADCMRVMGNFFHLRGRDFYGGLVFREFLLLKKLGMHPKVKMPLPIEYRTFFLHQKPITSFMYWEHEYGAYPDDVVSPPQDWLEALGKKMVSPFVALDTAQSEDGKWWLIEVNDGGIAGWPEHLDPKQLYSSIYAALPGKNVAAHQLHETINKKEPTQ